MIIETLLGITAVLSGALGLFTLTADLPKFNKGCWCVCGLAIVGLIIF